MFQVDTTVTEKESTQIVNSQSVKGTKINSQSLDMSRVKMKIYAADKRYSKWFGVVVCQGNPKSEQGWETSKSTGTRGYMETCPNNAPGYCTPDFLCSRQEFSKILGWKTLLSETCVWELERIVGLENFDMARNFPQSCLIYYRQRHHILT